MIFSENRFTLFGIMPRLVAPALLPQPLADGAGDARGPRLGRDHALRRLPAGDLQHELGADRLLELLALADRDDECARSANHAILVVDVELVDIHGAGVR